MFNALKRFFRLFAFWRKPAAKPQWNVADVVADIAANTPEPPAEPEKKVEEFIKNEFTKIEEKFIYSKYKSEVNPECVTQIACMLSDDPISAEWEANEMESQAIRLQIHIRAIAALDPELAEKIAEYIEEPLPADTTDANTVTGRMASMMDEPLKPLGADYIDQLYESLPKAEDTITGRAPLDISEPQYCAYYREPEREHEGVKWNGAIEICSHNRHPIIDSDIMGWKKVATHVKIDDPEPKSEPS